LLLATTNAGKAAEFSALLAGTGLAVVGLSDLGVPPPGPPVEDGPDFASNARLKAGHYLALTGRATLADDSGLVVPALGGRPGVNSARYGGPGLSDRQRCERLLAEMEGEADRRAWFEAVLALAAPGVFLAWSGRLSGRLARQCRGEGGFGYDPVFIPEGFSITLAEMAPGDKNRISHRSRALAGLLSDLDRVLEALGGGG
jgi:XTP/dITP diphosphohydrolase